MVVRILLLILVIFGAIACSATPIVPAPPPPTEQLVVPASVAISSELRDQGSGRPLAGDQAPDFAYTFGDDTSVSLAELRGRPVIVNFWATWCLPCRQELPAFAEVRASQPDLVILAVNRNEAPETVVRFAQELGLELPMVVDFSGAIGDRYGVTNLPTTFFIAPDGTIFERRLGELNREQIEMILKEMAAR